MIEGHIIFNAILYSIVIAYILYINFSAYYQTGTGFLKALVNLFQNWIFRTVYLLIVGFFALDLFPYGGFVLAILLTIAFLNTNMLVYKKDVEESFTMPAEQYERKMLPSDGPVGGNTQTGPVGGTTQKETPLIGNVGSSVLPSNGTVGVNSQTGTVSGTSKKETPLIGGTVGGNTQMGTVGTTAKKETPLMGTGTGTTQNTFSKTGTPAGQVFQAGTPQTPPPPSFATQQQQFQ